MKGKSVVMTRPMTNKEGEVREITLKEMREFRPAKEVLPPKLFAALTRRRGERGKQKKPTKAHITIRLDQDIVDHFRGLGNGWQSRINATLRKSMKHSSK